MIFIGECYRVTKVVGEIQTTVGDETMIKKGEYYRGKNYQALGQRLEHELETLIQAEDYISAGSKNDLLKYLQHAVSTLPVHIRNKILMKLQANAHSKSTLLAYIYNYILCCDGMRVIN